MHEPRQARIAGQAYVRSTRASARVEYMNKANDRNHIGIDAISGLMLLFDYGVYRLIDVILKYTNMCFIAVWLKMREHGNISIKGE